MDTSKLFSLQGRVALVTGGSRGIGKMVAEGFVAQGARVYISARDAAACDVTALELSRLGECRALPVDVSTLDGIDHLVSRLGEHEPALDILVNNAGVRWMSPLAEFPEYGWDADLNLNLKTPFFLTQRMLPLLTAAATDHLAKVINIASVDGISLHTGESYSYHASKAGLIHLTRRMAIRLIQDRVVVAGIAPGAFASEMNPDARDRPDSIVSAIPAARVGAAEDMAAAAIYLAARSGDYVVGSTVIVDGGVTHAR